MVNPTLVVGHTLAAGQKLYSYEGEDENGRPIIITYLDRNPRDVKKQIIMTHYTAFVEKQSEMLRKYRDAKRWNKRNQQKKELEEGFNP